MDECEEGTCGGFQVDVVRRAVFNADWLADNPLHHPSRFVCRHFNYL